MLGRWWLYGHYDIPQSLYHFDETTYTSALLFLYSLKGNVMREVLLGHRIRLCDPPELRCTGAAGSDDCRYHSSVGAQERDLLYARWPDE